ncbi:acyltransferase family protein [Marinobacter bryozoorum]|uniref:acyltransferase family protein n=1 Tax=Marinobacter bryozoorum TaxID=256324 RepID=UPI0020033CA9|nr:acyltransferase family protein [Marinobacter bryozoorum]MCK7544043.1 acyltransferase family protein [Marinobacter bryozoorum]
MMSQDRLQQLDLLRGLLMLLGVVIHAGFVYTVEQKWLIKDSATHQLFDYLVFWINVFRMPAFFFLSGLLFAMVVIRKAPLAFLGSRLVRIGIPLIVAAILLNIPQLLISDWLAPAFGQARITESPCQTMYDIYAGCWASHLWFLVTLIYFFMTAHFVHLLTRRLRVNERVSRTVAAAWCWPLLLLALSGFGYAVQSLWWRGGNELFSHLPFLWTLSYFQYLPFFLAGFLFARLFCRLQDWAVLSPARLGALVVSWGGLFYLYVAGSVGRVQFYFSDFVVTLLYYAVAFQIITFLVAVFVRYVHVPSARTASVVDASYTVYLVHHPLVFGVALLLSFTNVPLLLKFLLIVLVASSLSIAFHYWLVRRSAILRFAVNGRYR